MTFRLLFTYMPLVAGILVVLGLVFPRCRQLRLRTRAQAVWTLVVLACCSKFVFYEALGGDAFNPDLPWPVMWAWNWAYSGAMLFVAFTLLGYFIRSRVKLVVIPVLAWGLAAVGLWSGLRLPDVVETELEFPDLPSALDGYRILQLSDLHISASVRRWRTEGIVARANAAGADLIVVTGDIADGEPKLLADDVEPLRNLRAKDGVYFITGNHESYGPWGLWNRLYTEWNLRFLHDECVFPRPGLALGGFDDAQTWRFKPDDGSDVATLFAAATNGEFRVLLEHQPGFARTNFASGRVDLQFSGHTHGGIMPVLASLVARCNDGFLRGAYPMAREGAWLYVSPGSGQWAGFPVRFLDPSEITLVTLRRR